MAGRRSRLAERRRAVGLSQERLADLLGADRSTVARWERGETAPQPWFRPRLARALKLSPEAAEALLADTGPAADDESVAAWLMPETSRSGPAIDSEAELRDRLLNAAAVDERMLALLTAQANHIREIDRRLGALAAQAQMRGYLTAIDQLRSFGVAPTKRQPLARLYADAATLAGWQCIDLGELHQAWRHYEAAKDATREGSPPAALAHAMAEQAYVLVELGEPADALQLAEHARSIAGSAAPPLFLSWLEAVLGELHAVVGNVRASYCAFETADKLLPGDSLDPELPYVILDSLHLARWRGNARATLGDAAATDELRRAVYGLDASFTRARAGVHVDLSTALAAGGRRSAAEAELGQARTLAARVGSARQRRRIRHLESRLHAL